MNMLEVVAGAKYYFWLPGITIQATGASAVILYAGTGIAGVFLFGQFVDYVREQFEGFASKRR